MRTPDCGISPPFCHGRPCANERAPPEKGRRIAGKAQAERSDGPVWSRAIRCRVVPHDL
jgi:hypothetical protein